MKKVLIALLALTFLLTGISAICESGQININSADATELDKLAGIGPAYASNIIDSRPFGSIDDLIDVKGIGPITLDKIKTQGLACVDGENEEEPEENIQEEDLQDNNSDKEVVNEENTNDIVNSNINNDSKTIITSEVIKPIILNAAPKDIKSETDKEQLSKNKLAIYGLIAFCLLLGLLFIFERKKKKNEFE